MSSYDDFKLANPYDGVMDPADAPMEHTCAHCVGVSGFQECGGDEFCHCLCGTPLPEDQIMTQDPATGKWGYKIPRATTVASVEEQG